MPRHILALLVTAAALVSAVPASAQMPTNDLPAGLEIVSVDLDTRSVTGIQHCLAPQYAGKQATFVVAPGVDMSFMVPGREIGVAVDPKTTHIVKAFDQSCRAYMPPPSGDHMPPPPYGAPGEPGPAPQFGEHAEELPTFASGFLNRVWKFQVDVDGFAGGKLSATVGKVLNVPKRFAKQDDELLDQDALVLVSSSTRIYEKGTRVKGKDLDEAETATISGKLLPVAKWQDDEDGAPVPTIRAKRVQITS